MDTEKGPILVTGATGFTGGHLCERLARSGYAVRALVRDPNRGSHLRHWGIDTVVGDLSDLQSVEHAMKGIKAVYHIAALFRQENLTRKDMWLSNVQGTKNMLDAAVKAGVERFIYCSTIGVHGDVKNPPANENTPYAPGDYYQESKTEAEELAIDYIRRGKLSLVVFRPGGIYGPRDLRFLKLFKAIKNKRFMMLGTGKVLYQMTYIDDLIDGILLCGTCPEAVGNIYILAGEPAVTLNELVRTIANILGVSEPRFRIPVTPVYLAGFICELLFKPFGLNPPIYRRRVDFFRKTRSFDISKAKKELGFTPKTDLKTGIQLTADWYRKEGLLQ